MKWAELGLGWVKTGDVGEEFRPEASISVGMGESWWEEKSLYL